MTFYESCDSDEKVTIQEKLQISKERLMQNNT